MTTTKTTKFLKQGLAFTAVLALVVLSLPVLAAVAFSSRLLIILALPAMFVALLVSPRLRSWLSLEDDLEAVSYKGLRLPHDVAVHPHHAWARADGGSLVTVGADDLLQGALGPLDEIGLPRLGREVKQGAPLAAMRSGARTAVLKAPVSGTVVAVNHELAESPRLLNDSPYAGGWTVQLRRTGPRSERRLLRRYQWARTWFRGEVDRLLASLASPALVPVAQDGGTLVPDFHAVIDADAWRRIKRTFFGDDD